jgi:hypothetical protein
MSGLQLTVRIRRSMSCCWTIANFDETRSS